MPGEPEPPAPRGWPPGFGRDDDERRALLTLAELRSLRPLHVHATSWAVGSARGCVDAVRAGRLGSDGDRAWLAGVDPGRTWERTTRSGAQLVTPADPGYDERLNDLRDPPACLFVRGRALPEARDRVAIVGSRKCSHLGRDVARDLGRALVLVGVTVVSGAAQGIDAAAHRGALDAGGRTVAVLGSGIDVRYPASSRGLLEEIAEHGTIVSEYPPGTPAGPQHFPARNRIVVALARALVVVEGASRSGSRISVDHALELGRDVFAVPGPVTSPLAETPLEMIREGATMIRGAADLLEDLGLGELPPAPPPDLDEDERRVFAALAGRSLPDALARQTRMSIPAVVTTLTRLEVRGLVVNVGGRYELRHRPAAPATSEEPSSGPRPARSALASPPSG
ncbi:MAG TPA: DNA-processing protein DprA [Actinomycetota bacterium]|nr:DNA-processing protein DprA [Actinomycetota bacterium]